MFPYIVQIGSLHVPSYGILVAIAFLTALWLASKLAKRRGLNSEKVVNLGVYCALTGMLGAKLMMVLLDPEYRAHPSAIFTWAFVQSAGIFFGGFLVAFVFAIFYMRAQGLPVLGTSDVFAPGLALGHGIGRLGCFAAGCCWGRPTELPWGVSYSDPNATTGVPLGIHLHPTQLYEAFGEGIICLILLAMSRRPHRDGQVIGLYMLLYGALRIAVEFVRDHDALNPFGGPLTLEQWISLLIAAAGLTLWVTMSRASVSMASR